MKSALAVSAFLVACVVVAPGTPSSVAYGHPVTEGRLDAFDHRGKQLACCPLEHTAVTVDISGFLARVTVQQRFQNPHSRKIEAIYVFPLSQNGAVDRMTMKVGKRTIEGEIKGRNAARRIYEQAKAAGHVAGLLDQERPNIFRQAVANIEPGERVEITISYCETLKWEDGQYEFVFPMVVGPRYMPGFATGSPDGGWSPPTDEVPDAHRISPKPPIEGLRAGHEVSLTVNLNAGLPIREVESKQHKITIDYSAEDRSRAVVKLRKDATIPNRDFVLVYRTTDEQIADTVLTHTDQRGKFFTLVLQPPKRVPPKMIVPKEMIFVIDKSGSMTGFPIETAKKAMRLCIEGLHPNDTFNLITFAGGVGQCFARPMPNTEEMRQYALRYLDHLQGDGSTEMMAAIHACLAEQHDPRRVRVVCFMTDGYVGNDMAIIEAVRQNAGTARVFAFGIGTSTNRYLLDEMARAGRGEVQYVLSRNETIGAAERFHQRVRTPVLTDVRIDFGDLPVEYVYGACREDGTEIRLADPPPKVELGSLDDLFAPPKPRDPDAATNCLIAPDLFSSKPLVIKGRYKGYAQAIITLHGRTGEGSFAREIRVILPDTAPENEVLAPLWARAKVDHLMHQSLTAIQSGIPNADIQEEILGLGLEYKLLTPYTSFVAVERAYVTENGPSTTENVRAEIPKGVSREGVFGGQTSANGINVQLDPYGEWTTPRSDLLREIGSYMGTGLSSRGAAARSAMVREGGGNSASEAALAAGLKWLVAHQLPDGSWSFHAGGDGTTPRFSNPGTSESKIHATSLALMAFLGAGQTHMEGNYKATVKSGLAYLIRTMKIEAECGDLRGKEGSMLAHAAATTVLSEAYAMTRDKALLQPAQLAINFMVKHYDPKTGGWAPKLGQAPSTIVTAWHLMALKSAHMAYLQVDPNAIKKAIAYLDLVQTEQGAHYRKSGAEETPTDDESSAAGLLCRMYVGWNHDHIALVRGVQHLGTAGPSKSDSIYNYFATQVMRHYGGEVWKVWNGKLRDHLVGTQGTEGRLTGSWFDPADPRASEGGRLMQTALNVMILEVYYRHMPLINKQATQDDFPL